MKTAPPEHKSKPAAEPRQPLVQPEAEREAGLGVGMPFFLASAAPPPVQPKLRLNQPGDRYEQEADRVATQVMRMPLAPADTVQRACSCGGTCAHCQGGDEAPLIQRATEGTTSATPAASTVLPSTNGQPLDAPTRQTFEARFGHDFSGVRIHSGPQATAKAAAIQARAFTTGNNIVFGAGAYAPGTQAGQTLLAHELAHVVQQRRGTSPPGQIQRVFDMENDPNIRRMREQQREQARHRAAEHRRWEASHQEHFRTELGSQATTLTEQQQRTEQNLMVQRNQVFEAVRSSESGGLFADLLRLAGLEITFPTTLPADLQQRWNAARQ
ncbi:MAG: DUF4157 domain-containing protein, partial [Chloroflexia bacterium]|nr:DUF4157 domain-containing protein [Chloroflexia bacterium]